MMLSQSSTAFDRPRRDVSAEQRTRRIALNGNRVSVTEVFDSYWYLAAERQAIFFSRAEGKPAPWTADPILARGPVVHPAAAAHQFAQDEAEVQPSDGDGDTDRDPKGKDPARVAEIEAPRAPSRPTRYYGRVTLASDRWTLVAADIAEGIVQRN